MMRCALHMRCYRSPASKETVTLVTNCRDGLFAGSDTHHLRTART
jgi:hypothetical protein